MQRCSRRESNATSAGRATLHSSVRRDARNDAERKAIAVHDLVRIFSSRGEVRIHAKVSDEVKPGILYTTFRFPEHLVNIVTSSECDEDTMCPEYKVVAVDVERVGAVVEKKAARPEMIVAT